MSAEPAYAVLARWAQAAAFDRECDARLACANRRRRARLVRQHGSTLRTPRLVAARAFHKEFSV